MYPLILCAAVVQIAGEGARWQMLPAYVAAIILGATGTTTGRVQDGFHLAAAGMIVVGFFLGVIYPVYTLPKPTGPYPVGTVLLDVPATMLKAAHATPPGAPLTIQVWYPAVSETGLKRAPYVVGGATTGIRAQLGRRRLVSTAALLDAKFFPDSRRRPLLLLTSGWGGTRYDNTAQAQGLASNGYVVAAMGDPYPEPPLDLSTERSFQKTLAWGDDKARREAEVAIAVLDFLCLLDTSDPEGRLFHRLDLKHVGILGFSFGGAVAQEAASLDTRFKAVANLDGWLFGDAANTWIEQPMLIMSDGPAVDSPPYHDRRTAQTAWNRYSALLDARSERQTRAGFTRWGGYYLTIAGTDHFNFSDQAFASPVAKLAGAGPLDRVRASRIIGDYLVQFFDKTLRGLPAPLLAPDATPDPAARLVIWRRPDVMDKRRAEPP